MELLDYLIYKKMAGNAGGNSGGGGGSDEEWFNDGDTHIWITLPEGRTSPVLGVCPNGTVTVDWGDGTTPDALTGTDATTVKYTPTHNYAEPGDYVITLTVDGEMGINSPNSATSSTILRHSSSRSENRNYAYWGAVKKVEIGRGVTSIGEYAFRLCTCLSAVDIPNSVTSIGTSAFSSCTCLSAVDIPNSVTSIGNSAFEACDSLMSVVIPNSVTSIGEDVFSFCSNMKSVAIEGEITSIGNYMFNACNRLVRVVIPNSVTSIGTSAFANCYSVAVYDFSKYTAVPALMGTNAFAKIPTDCEIRVPAALYDEWIAATNWSTYASQIVAV